MPLVVVVAYQLADSGWRGMARMRAGMGTAILAVLIVPWWLLAAFAGRDQFVRDVVRADMMQGYNPLRALAWSRAIEPLGAALTILLPWSLLLPFAVRWAARRWKTPAAAGERLALIWSITLFVVVAVSSLQREPAPLFALEAPELVFSFYLRRSIPVVSSTAELRGVDPPVYVIARDPPAPEAFDPVAQGFVKGRPFVLWSKQ